MRLVPMTVLGAASTLVLTSMLSLAPAAVAAPARPGVDAVSPQAVGLNPSPVAPPRLDRPAPPPLALPATARTALGGPGSAMAAARSGKPAQGPAAAPAVAALAGSASVAVGSAPPSLGDAAPAGAHLLRGGAAAPRVSPAVVTVPSTAGARTFATPDWQGVAVAASSPPARAYPFAAYDAARQRDVVFGGYGSGGFLADTWTFDGTRWTQASPGAAPSARDGAQMAYDAATGTTILFGGYTSTGALADTWSWNGSSWAQLHPAVSPPARSQGVLAYDPALSRLVLFGGYGAGYLDDTWTFDGSTWTQAVTPAGPAARADSGLAYDASAGALVLYGGSNGSAAASFFGDTWTYTSAGWAQAAPAHFPGARSGHGLAYDPVLARVVFLGGGDASYTHNDVWMWDGADWQRASSAVVPSYRSTMALVQAAGHGQLMAYGGNDPSGAVLGDTHLYDWLGLGSPHGATLESAALTDRSSYAVNVGNGNLTVAATDLTVHGVGVDLAITRVYNAKAPTTTVEVGNGWSLTTGRDTYLSGLPDGSQVLYGYAGASGQLYFHRNPDASFTSPPGLGTTLAAAGGGYTLTVNSSGEVFTFGTPQSNGLLASDADRNGNAIRFTYTSGQQLSGITDIQGRAYTLAYTISGYLRSITDPTGRSATYTQDLNGYLTLAADGGGNTTAYYYNSAGALDTVQDANAGTTVFGYDGDFKLTSTTQQQTSAVTGHAYTPPPAGSAAWLTSTTTDANSHPTTYQASYAGPVTMVTDALGRSRPSTYTANGDVLTATDAMGSGNSGGNTTTYTYNSTSSPTSARMPTGATGWLGYANGDNLGGSRSCASTDTTHPYLAKCAADAQGNMASFGYDGPGNLTQASSPTMGVMSSSTYNPPAPGTAACGGKPGQLCSSTDANHHTTTDSYDSTGTLTAVTPPAPLGATHLTADALGRVATVTDGKSQTTRYSYDGDDHVTQVLTGGATSCTSRAPTCLTSSYDGNGNRTSQDDSTGHYTYGYDAANRQTTKTTPRADAPGLTYDKVGNVATYSDAAGTVSYGYDAANELTTLSEPGGDCSTSPGTLCTRFGYNNNATRTSTTYPGTTVLSVTPDASGRVSEIKAVQAGTVLSDFTYGHTANGADQALTSSRTDAVTGKTTSYAYDSLERLTRAVETANGATTASWLYCYDLVGNRTGESTTLGATCSTPSTTYGYNAADELTSRNGSTTGWSYDANGNETAGLGSSTRTAETYSASDQLLRLTSNGTATPDTYAGLGNTERTSAGPTTYLTGEEGLANQTTNGATTTWTRDPAGTLISQRVNGASYYYLYDGQGSVTGLVDKAGSKVDTYSYDPYGKTRDTSETVPNPFRYTGGYYDGTSGLYHLNARYYDPSVGRFTQPDPSAQESNAYAYAGGCPSHYSDPSGLFHFFAGLQCIQGLADIALNALPLYRSIRHLSDEVGGLRTLFRLVTDVLHSRPIVSDLEDEIRNLTGQLIAGFPATVRHCGEAFS